MKRIIGNIIILLIFLTGLSILLYPAVSDYVNQLHSSQAIADYENSVTELREEDHTQSLLDAAGYNEYLKTFSDLGNAVRAEEEREDSPYNSLLNVTGNGIMGSIRIPCIKVNLPIYHGTDEAILQVAVGHYEGSSLPIGGESTHAILTGHRGLPSARLFTDLDRMEVGDIFYLKVLGEILEYQIDQIQIVLPEEVDGLSIVRGEDYVTLVTCTPYGINSHRMLIRGTRIPYDGNYEEEVEMKPAPEHSDVPKEEQGNGFTTKQWLLFGAAAFGAAIGAGLLIPGKKQGGTSPEGSEKKSGESRKRKLKKKRGTAGEAGRENSGGSTAGQKEGGHEERE